MSLYSRVIANHPYIVVLLIATLSMTCLVVSLLYSNTPNFGDPQLGFEARGTEIAGRLTAWENLLEATRPSGPLTGNPSYIGPLSSLGQPPPTPPNSITSHSAKLTRTENAGKWLGESAGADKDVGIWVTGPSNVSRLEISKEDEEWTELYRDVEGKGLGESHSTDHSHQHLHLADDGFFCDGLSSEYSHLVIKSTQPLANLFNLDSMLSVCDMQTRLMQGDLMPELCQTVTLHHCCAPWSLPNYIALLYNKTTCSQLMEEDMLSVKLLLIDCAKFYNNLQLQPNCRELDLCPDLPVRCTKHNAVFNILYYLTDTAFLPSNQTLTHHATLNLSYTMMFLPIARSQTVLPYYHSLSPSLYHGAVRVAAIDFGVKDAVFDEHLMKDSVLMVTAAVFIIVCMWCYAGSLFITLCAVLAMATSLNMAYFIYTFVFNIRFFPFMNMLAVVVAIGIGADDMFILCKMWQCAKAEKVNATVARLVSDTLNQSVLSMLVTSFTTAAAFYSNCINSITAINCFSIFAGTATLINFVLMVTWLPAAVVIADRWWCPSLVPPQWRPYINTTLRTATEQGIQVRARLDRCLVLTVVRLRWLWFLLLLSVGVAAAVVVFHYPRFLLPDSKTFQLFQSTHLLEQYDLVYKHNFSFERLEKTDHWDNANAKLPLRFVWGVLPVDNGNYLLPTAKGTLEFDTMFDMAAPESQVWLLSMCRHLRQQSFYQSTLGPLLPNCVMESFKTWMQRRCKDSIDKIDRTPCCEMSQFPYSRRVFNLCIVQAMTHMYETPAEYFLPGVAGPKFSKDNRGEIKAVVVEYDSNVHFSLSFSEMNAFYSQVESWFRRQLLTAPPGLRRGWFVSHLDFYELQRTLSEGTVLAIAVAMTVALVVVFLVTLNVLVTLYAIISITFIIFVTVACLVLLGWRLNVLESVAVTTAIGLAVDFSLHYGVHYRQAEDSEPVPFALSRMAGPTLMAALTTAAAGAFMLFSSVLAYIQIGTFLVIVMAVSWLYSTLFLMPLLSIAGPKQGRGQLHYSSVVRCLLPEPTEPAAAEHPVYSAVLSESTMSTSSFGCVHDVQEVDASARRRARRAMSSRSSHKMSAPADHSPSGTSATTVMLADDLEVETRPRGSEEVTRH